LNITDFSIRTTTFCGLDLGRVDRIAARENVEPARRYFGQGAVFLDLRSAVEMIEARLM
jgi:hypothetical protein